MDDKVSVGVFQQVMWERDVALAQLAEIGKGLGAKMDDVRPVTRGRWIVDTLESLGGNVCSACNVQAKGIFYKTKFCPNCGADMREVDDAK